MQDVFAFLAHLFHCRVVWGKVKGNLITYLVIDFAEAVGIELDGRLCFLDGFDVGDVFVERSHRRGYGAEVVGSCR